MTTAADQPPGLNEQVARRAKASKRRGAKSAKRTGATPAATGTSDASLASDVPNATPTQAAGDDAVPCCADVVLEANGRGGAAPAVPRAADLRAACLCRSLRHQRKFHSVRSAVLAWAKQTRHRHLLQGTGKEGRFFAFLVNDAYAFRHICKSGGTTVELQTHARKRGQVPAWRVGDRQLFATVRDPLERFLSGWAECGSRHFDAMAHLTSSDAYDARVRAWLGYLRATGGNTLREAKGAPNLRTCRPHSMPQANYLWQSEDDFEWHARLDLVGHLSELPGLLEVVGRRYDPSIRIGNEAAENDVKTRHFPRAPELLSDDTVRDICRYLAVARC